MGNPSLATNGMKVSSAPKVILIFNKTEWQNLVGVTTFYGVFMIICSHAELALSYIFFWQFASYFLMLLHTYGFEFSLIFHIIFAIISSLHILTTSFRIVWLSFTSAVLCCFGFVFLKVYDHEFTCSIFSWTLSGHFWSKLCDALQIHFVAEFFWQYMMYNAEVRKQ